LVVAVVDAVDYPDGKFSAALGNVVVIEVEYLRTLIAPLLALVPGATQRPIEVQTHR
jgi:hypothetical protein